MEVVKTETITHTVEVPSKLEDFKDWEFTSGTQIGKDFKKFARLFKKFVKDNLPINAEFVDFNKGHYILSGFVEKDGNFVYFSISDVRHFKNEWAENILIRTTRGTDDFTGGSNNYTNLENFEKDIKDLLKG